MSVVDSGAALHSLIKHEKYNSHLGDWKLGRNMELVQLNQKGKYFIFYETTPGVPDFPLLIKPYYMLVIH